MDNGETKEGLVSVIIPTYNRETTLKRGHLKCDSSNIYGLGIDYCR